MTEATKVPKLKRSDRTTETREKTVRRKAWAPPSRLDAPEPPPGYKHRWIRVESGGADDRANVSAKLREGYELVRADEYPDFDSGVQDDGKHAGVIGVGGLLLARIPEETADERQEYYSSRTHDQIRAADNDLLKTNVNSSMKINAPERQSKVSLGGPRSGSE
jgi:hypothetical protein|tara:strand:+ start:345 stop:833 length:489 start_codon:yes stop_codon:yes gene_type:complete